MARVLLVIVMMTLSGVGCKKAAELDQLGYDGDSPSEPQTCSECTQRYCQDEVATCTKDPSCKETQHCVDECRVEIANVGTCDAICLEKEYEVKTWTDVSLCQGKYCEDQCERRCGGFLYRNDICRECAHIHCCDLENWCANDPSCLDSYDCHRNSTPGDWASYQDCDEALGPEKRDMFIALKNCFQGSCAVECDIGKAWACVSKTSPINVSPRDTSMELKLVSLANEPIAEAAVDLCRAVDYICEHPLASAHSRSDGVAVLEYHTSPFATSQSYVKIAAPERIGARLFFSGTLSAGPTRKLDWLLPTKSELEVLGNISRVAISPEYGHTLVYLLDCAMDAARDLIVRVVGIDDAAILYLRNDIPDISAEHTDYGGAALIFNLPPGNHIIEAAPVGSPEKIVLRATLPIRPSEISYALIWPE